jgi:Periplasmic copper-binding protein (NosD)
MKRIVITVLTAVIAALLPVSVLIIGPVFPALADGNGPVLRVAPSGDMTGVVDATHIEIALNHVKASGGTVWLTDNDHSTVDTFYVSRGIVVEDFRGTVRGEGKHKTIVEAVPGPTGSFEFTYTSSFAPKVPPFVTNYPTLFWFEGANGLSFESLTLQVLDHSPADTYIMEGSPTTALFALVADMGGEGDTTFNNVMFSGASGDYVYIGAPGTSPKNLNRAVHSQKGPDRFTAGIGDFIAEGTDLEEMAFGLFAGPRKDARITIGGSSSKKNVARNVGNPYPVFGLALAALTPIDNSRVTISNNEVHDSFLADIWMGRFTNSEITVMGNSLEGGERAIGAILLNYGQSATIKQNTIVGSGPFAISLYASDNSRVQGNDLTFNPAEETVVLDSSSGNVILGNNYEGSLLPGWTGAPNSAVCQGGPGAVNLKPNSNNNWVVEDDFPNDTTSSTQVCDQGIGNIIKK